jgi:Ser/Thr protein kinase RdoA (MazF antagonist)
VDATEAARAWIWDPAVRVEPVPGGLINQTWAVVGRTGPVAFLQRLNTGVFRPEVHEDIEAVTARLAVRGLATPRLLRTAAGALWHEREGEVWRALTPVGSATHTALPSPSHAASAGRLVGRVHEALRDFDHEFRMVRPGAHDTTAHFAALAAALDAHGDHRLHAAVADLAAVAGRAWDAWVGPRDLPRRVIHGDLKVSNLRFDGEEAVALVDLDTFAWGTLDVELGDALRSWCNPASEDAPEPVFRADLFEAALSGYAATGTATASEWDALVPGVERIALELSSRFLRDALRECAFGWDPRFGTRGDHNLLRGRGQLALARSVAAQRSALCAAVDRWRTA